MHENYKSIVEGRLCKGSKDYPGYIDKNGAEIAKECFLTAGEALSARGVLPVAVDDTYQSYTHKLSVDWEVLLFTDGFVLKDFDWLVFAWSEDGTEAVNGERIFSQDGNLTTGFLIEAEGDFPVVWLSHDPSVLGGVFPLSDCLEKRHMSENKRGKIDTVLRLKRGSG